MKSIFTLFFIVVNTMCLSAQWSNTSNLFTDSLSMSVCTSTGEQIHPVVIQSQPDKGWFVIWEDKRNGYYSPGQVYAQKFDKNGNKLWATNGIPVSAGTNNQHFTWSSNQDYRNRKVAVSDNVGGLYLTYIDDSIATYTWQRICVQHLTPAGNPVFAGAGYIVARTPSGESYNYAEPQLIADNDGGFFISYINTRTPSSDYVYVANLKDISGTLKSWGSALMNENILNKVESDPCGGGHYLIYDPGTTVWDYNIWPDGQGNCDIAISMNGNTGAQGNLIAYNKLWKAKQDTVITIAVADTVHNISSQSITYHKGDASALYQFRFNTFTRECHTETTAWVITDYIITSPGFATVNSGNYEYTNPKGVSIPTGDNINIATIAYGTRTLTGNTVSNPAVMATAFREEIYSAVPYQRSNNTDPNNGNSTIIPANLATFSGFSDTLLPSGIYGYDFNLASGGQQLYAAALVIEQVIGSTSPRNLYLQHLYVKSTGAHSYAFDYSNTPRTGAKIGAEVSTGFGGTDIFYDFPIITPNATGNALFSINENGRYPRISPIQKDAQLAWGSMGRPIGEPYYKGNYINFTGPATAIDSTDGSGIITWYDSRNVNGDYSNNIFMRHIDSLNVVNYIPLNKKVSPLQNGSILTLPANLLGTTLQYTLIEAMNFTTGNATPVIELLDNYNLGSISASVYENTTGSIRFTNSKPYLDRDYTITPQNNPAGAADINVRLYFTTAEFDALKAADPTISNPGQLSVIKQPGSGNAPAELIITGGETELLPIAWKAVDGGYYLEVKVNSFSNFFIQKVSAALPVKWLNVQAQYSGAQQATISWKVAEQLNIKDYTVQQSEDAIHFTNVCTVAASSSSNYQCTVTVNPQQKHYFRIVERDVDNASSYSKTVVLQPAGTPGLAVYPNPAKDRLYINGITASSMISVADISGKLLQQQQLAAGSQSINTSSLVPGLYLLTIKDDKGMHTIKFVKE